MSERSRTFWQFNVGHLLTLASLVGSMLWFTAKSDFRLQRTEADVGALQIGTKANTEQIGELRQATYGLAYDLKALRETAQEIKGDFREFAKNHGGQPN